MRKYWALGLGSTLFVGLLAATPFVLGVCAEKQVKQLFSETPLPPGLTVDVQDYQRGYLGSSFRLHVTVTPPSTPIKSGEAPHLPTEFMTEAHLVHGPLLRTNQGWRLGLGYLHGSFGIEDLITLAADSKKALQAYIEGSELVTMDVVFGITGGKDLDFKTTRVHFDDPQGTVQWGGLSGKMIYSRGFSKPEMQLGLRVSPLLLQSKGEHPATIDSAEMKIYSHTRLSKDKLWIGSQVIDMPAFYLKDEQNNVIRFDHFRATTFSDITADNLASIEIKAHADNVTFFSQQMKRFESSLKINRLDAVSLVNFSNFSDKNSAHLTDADRQSIASSMIGMLVPGADFKFSHFMQMTEGDANVKMSVVFPDLSQQQAQEKGTVEVLAQHLLTKLKASLSFTLPIHWFEDTLYRLAILRLPDNVPAYKDPKTGVEISAKDAVKNEIMNQLKTLTDQHVLLKDNQLYSFLLTYQEGALALNGKTLNQDDIKQIVSELQTAEVAANPPQKVVIPSPIPARQVNPVLQKQGAAPISGVKNQVDDQAKDQNSVQQ